MAQPTAYNRIASFTNLQALNPSTVYSGATVDAEFNAVKATLDATLANLALIQNDDTSLKNISVGLAQLKSEVTVGFQVPVVWVTATAYATSNTVFNGSAFYRCLVAHTSGTFATDLAALKWQLIVDLSTIATVSATQVAVTPSGNLTTNVQTSLVALDAAKAATSHTHPSSAISDSTADGRAFLTATLAAQKVLLGLPAAVTAITAQIAFSGIITPAALLASIDNWAPTGLATCNTIRASASITGVQIYGLLAPAADGDVKIIENIGTANELTVAASATSSVAANRFLMPKPIVIAPNTCAVFTYDLTATSWRPVSTVSRFPRGHIDGLTLSNAADAVNDITIASGEARGTRGILDMVLSAAITKELDVDWAAGNAVGGRYVSSPGTPAIANTTYHVFLIGKADGTTDVIYYTGVDPTALLPAGYIDYRRVGSIMRSSGALFVFTQYGNEFWLTTPVLDVNAASSAGDKAITVPLGFRFKAMVNVGAATASGSPTSVLVYVTSPDVTLGTPSTTVAPLATSGVVATAGTLSTFGTKDVWTNTASQVRMNFNVSSGTVVAYLVTLGWIDTRGRDA